MFKLLLIFAFIALVWAQRPKRPLVFEPVPPSYRPNPVVKMCTYTEVSYEKCVYTTEVAQNNSIALPVQCILQDSLENCIESVKRRTSDLVVLNDHGYKPARTAGLRPFIYAREDDESLYIAVAPRNITLLGVHEAPIYFDHSKHRAFHAAVYFNSRMGHDICSFLNEVSLSPYIYIVDSVNYVPNADEILICPNHLPGEFTDYKTCNVEAGLERAVFIRSDTPWKQKENVRRVFDTISNHFGANSENFNFFDTFQGQEDVIFKNNTISLDLAPYYHNGVDEEVFNNLHCNNDDQPHDPRELW